VIAVVASAISCGSKFSAAGKRGSGGTAGMQSGGAAGEGGKGDSGSATGGRAGRGGASSGGKGGTSGLGGAPATAGSGGGSGADPTGDGGEAGSGTPPTPTCDPVALVQGCVPQDDGVFVSPNGDDGDDGTASSPLATLTAAIGRAASSGAPIFVCRGTFDEHLVVSDDGIAIHGGFACPSGGAPWVYDPTKRARVAPSSEGYALRITSVTGLTVTDLELESASATTPGGSSVAVFATRSTDVTLARVRITAGDGAKGEDGTVDESNHTSATLGGNSATGGTGAPPNDTCLCPDGTSSVGARGGNGGLTPTPGGAGLPDEGGGQPGTVGSCASVGTGKDGHSPPESAYGLGANRLGVLTASGWAPGAGHPGANGKPGQGGGGGAGATTGGGGGGGCGGCGGKAGGAGSGGGASIGFAAFRSTIALDAVVITTGSAGDGGAGVAGELGQPGGAGGAKTSLACKGGMGAAGADGSAGGGGAGGISVGILSSPDSIVTPSSSTTFDIGMPGMSGLGGAQVGSNSGLAGTSGEVLEAT
jgi:hypothetical protein